MSNDKELLSIDLDNLNIDFLQHPEKRDHLISDKSNKKNTRF